MTLTPTYPPALYSLHYKVSAYNIQTWSFVALKRYEQHKQRVLEVSQTHTHWHMVHAAISLLIDDLKLFPVLIKIILWFSWPLMLIRTIVKGAIGNVIFLERDVNFIKFIKENIEDFWSSLKGWS